MDRRAVVAEPLFDPEGVGSDPDERNERRSAQASAATASPQPTAATVNIPSSPSQPASRPPTPGPRMAATPNTVAPSTP